MTPREPDRFEASCGVHGQRSWWRDGHCICAELRAAESSALERAAQEYGAEDLANIKVYCRHVAQRLRALASPAAAPAAETGRCETCGGARMVARPGGYLIPCTACAPPSEPAPLLPRVLAALDIPSVLGNRERLALAAELRAYIAELEGGAEAPDSERDRNRHNAMLVEAWRAEFGTLCKALFPGDDGPIGWKHIHAKIAELLAARAAKASTSGDGSAET